MQKYNNDLYLRIMNENAGATLSNKCVLELIQRFTRSMSVYEIESDATVYRFDVVGTSPMKLLSKINRAILEYD